MIDSLWKGSTSHLPLSRQHLGLAELGGSVWTLSSSCPPIISELAQHSSPFINTALCGKGD